jgi:[ribosomal protein S5]-alanine N-acetyltransferase
MEWGGNDLGDTGDVRTPPPPSPRTSSTVSLRDCVPSDLDALTAYWAAGGARYVGDRRPLPEDLHDATRAFLDGAISSAREVPRTRFVLVAEVNGHFVGTGRIEVRDAANASGDLGYGLREDAWGLGYGTQIARQLVDIGFSQLMLQRVWATVHPENAASIRVLEKAGLSYEGRLRDYRRVPGGWQDSLLYAATRSDWARR